MQVQSKLGERELASLLGASFFDLDIEVEAFPSVDNSLLDAPGVRHHPRAFRLESSSRNVLAGVTLTVLMDFFQKPVILSSPFVGQRTRAPSKSLAPRFGVRGGSSNLDGNFDLLPIS
jgi:hypothetical protein